IRTIADIESAMVIRSLHRQDHLSQIEIGALLAKYIVRACFSQQRMVYISVEKSVNGVASVIYTSRDGRSQKTFDALDWLAILVTHIPCRYEQTVRYYGYYSNTIRHRITHLILPN
ncbi:MAG: transposase, partial [Desulfobacteraceae bacterium]